LDYKNYNDFELVYAVRENNEYAYNAIINKYTALIKKIAEEYYIKNKHNKIDYEDLVQEGYVGLIQALNKYDESTTLFYTFATLCVRREMERLLKTHNRMKQMALNNAISFNSSVNGCKDILLEDVVPSKDNLEEYIISETNVIKLMNYKHELPIEMSYVYELRYNKFNNDEISILLDMPKKKVEKYVNKIKKEVKKYYLRIS